MAHFRFRAFSPATRVSRKTAYLNRCPLAIFCRARSAVREVVVGIDLGTTNSAIAYIEGGKPKCIPNSLGETITPSVVTIQQDGSAVVGKQARRQAVLHPATTYYSVKRLIGRQLTDPRIQEEVPRLAYKVQADDDGNVALACQQVEPGILYPEEVSARVLRQLLDDAEAYTKGHVTKAIISVPAYFNEEQKEATLAAAAAKRMWWQLSNFHAVGKLAGLEVVKLLPEPVAAALAYGLNLKEDQTVLVFDLGGGTYDISLLEVGNGTVEVLSTGGDPHLGGDDWDAAIIRWLRHNHLTDSQLDWSDPRLLSNLKGLAESAKLHLTDHPEVVLRMPVGGPKGGPVEAVLTRELFDELTTDLYRRCRQPLDAACWQAGVDLDKVVGELEATKQQLRSRGVAGWKIDTMQPVIKPKQRGALSKILLVGGATRMPAVRRFVANMTGMEPVAGTVDPDEAVALGAAVQAGILQGEIQDMMVIDQWQASLMRAMAQLQLRSNADVKKKVEEQYDLDDDSDTETGSKPLSKRQRRRLREQRLQQSNTQQQTSNQQIQEADAGAEGGG